MGFCLVFICFRERVSTWETHNHFSSFLLVFLFFFASRPATRSSRLCWRHVRSIPLAQSAVRIAFSQSNLVHILPLRQKNVVTTFKNVCAFRHARGAQSVALA